MPRIAASERDAYFEARRTELVTVALRLWAENGFDQTSVAAIAREAGVPKGTFYLYYESKDALLEEVLRRNSFVPNVLQLVEDLQHRSLEDAVHGFVRGAWRHLQSHRELVLVVLRELPTHLDEAQQMAERVMAPANRLLAEYLESRIDAERARFEERCHADALEEMARTRPRAFGAVTFNLGYLPGDEDAKTRAKRRRTNASTTLRAVSAALECARVGGVVTVVAYLKHEGGAEEHEAVREALRASPTKSWTVTERRVLNRNAAPVLYVARRAAE